MIIIIIITATVNTSSHNNDTINIWNADEGNPYNIL